MVSEVEAHIQGLSLKLSSILGTDLVIGATSLPYFSLNYEVLGG